MFFIVPLLLFLSEVHSHPGIQEGVCFVNYTTRVPTLEPYTYTKRVQKHEKCGYRYCLKEQVVLVNEQRYVYRDVVHQRPECCSGYEKVLSSTSKHGFDCIPVCEPLCVFGHCTSPGNCTCNDGYVHFTSNVCGPACMTACEFGNCTGPNICTCFEGYIKYTDTICKPSCIPACINGECVHPNVCECNSGFKFHSSNHSICEPSCADECVNATCIKPNECQCIKGYEKLPMRQNICKPSCSLECINGDCTDPEKCTCKEGYHLENESWNNCVPDCNCTNGYCHEPNKCICIQNYTLNEEGDCEPICEDCVNSTCTSPYMCECLDGYRQYNRTVCVPYCSDCYHGMCTEPEVCSCFEGYENDGSTCEPVCTAGCANGLCTAPNKCTCESDHDEVLENVCLPLCEGNCSDCNVTDAECLFTLPSKVSNFLLGHEPSMTVSIPVNCNYLSNSSCTLCGCQRNNCTGISIECTVIKRLRKPYLLCMLSNNDTYLEGIYEETVQDVEFLEDISSIYKNKMEATVLFPRTPEAAKGECELCSCLSNTRNTADNKFLFQMVPCSAGVKEKIHVPPLLNDSMLWYIIIAGAALCLLFIVALGILIASKRKIHEYVVNRNDQLRNEACDYETEMLHPDTD